MKTIFEGIKVLDLTNNIAGPYSTAMLADYGAEVIKVEKPNGGDDSRAWAPLVDGVSAYYLWHNRGKKSIVLDFKSDADLEIIRKLVKQMDVVVESFRPGIMDKYRLGYQDLAKINPKIILCSISAFGQTGPYRNLPGYDLIAQAMSGVMDVTGEADGPPQKLGPSIADYSGGFNAFGAISAALFYRERTGLGQHIDVSLLECIIAANDYCEPAFMGRPVTRNGNHHSMLAPYGVFNGKDGSIVIGVLNPKLWDTFTTIIGKPELATDPRFVTASDRIDHLPEVIEIIEEWLCTLDQIDDGEKLLKENGIPCAKVLRPIDLKTDPHLLERGTVTELQLPDSNKKLTTRGVHIKFSKTPGKLGIPPKLGEHQQEIFERFNIAKK
ncbi:CoA transferase [Brevibacillus ruminantium]|uniref:CoA transferase n=1 Tax=Brevibacillus ruminantium TaxID=2950604 RepID=A0ABY4WD14_9BACL|nr:CoA transferase [Brevibacillus ruminantium]USG65068.1 CoA transferase [Brevibacillus ruminantium]